MKKIIGIIFIIIAVIVLTLPVSASTILSGNDFVYTISGGEATILRYTGSTTGVVVIPDELEGVPVTIIANFAFNNSSNPNQNQYPNQARGDITSITIPSTVTFIGNNAFTNCINLEEVIINTPSELITIGHAAFLNCGKLTSFDIPNGVEEIGESVFGNTSLTKITIPATVKTIGAAAFATSSSYTSSLKEVVFEHDDFTGKDFASNMFTGTSNDISFIVSDTAVGLESSGLSTILGNNVVRYNALEPIISSFTQSSYTYFQGDTAKSMTVSASVSDGGTLSYQWYSNDTSSIGGTAIDGATSTSYTPPINEIGAIYYYVTVTNTNEKVVEGGNTTALKESSIVAVNVYDLEAIITGNINYEINKIIITGKVNGMENTDYKINLTDEKLLLTSSYKVGAYSIDGGNKWKVISSKPFDDVMFKKLLSKDITLVLTDKYDKKGKKTSDDAVIIEFQKINKRPKLRKCVINYGIGADLQGKTTGTWVLSLKNGTEAIKNGIEIAVADAANKYKEPDSKGWGMFYPGSTNGIAVVPLPESNKPMKVTYLIREGAKDDGGIYTAASKEKRIKAVGEQKPPNYKIDTKKNIIKYKANTHIYKGDIDTATDESSAKVELQKSKGEVNTKNYTGDIHFWIAATAKKPASAKQKITIN